MYSRKDVNPRPMSLTTLNFTNKHDKGQSCAIFFTYLATYMFCTKQKSIFKDLGDEDVEEGRKEKKGEKKKCYIFVAKSAVQDEQSLLVIALLHNKEK